MIKEIVNAFSEELKALFDNDGVTVLRDTQFKEQDMPAYTLPLVIIGLSDSPEMAQLSGGVTQATWNWNVRAYFIDSNASLSSDNAFSTNDYEIIEKIVNHFNFRDWLTTEFEEITNTFSFVLTFQDISKAPVLENAHGIVQGFQISYESISYDTKTAFTIYSGTTLQKVNQLPFDNN